MKIYLFHYQFINLYNFYFKKKKKYIYIYIYLNSIFLIIIFFYHFKILYHRKQNVIIVLLEYLI